MRVIGFAIGVLALLGCALTHAPLPADGEPPATNNPLLTSGDQRGQSNTDDATVASVSSEAADAAALEPDALTLAAECLERGDRARAAVHLEDYVCRHPDQWMFRVQLAEMLLALGRDALARAHFERFIADAPSSAGPARAQIINAHTRLMEIAERASDRFGELFHRGAGLLLLAGIQEKLPAAEADPTFAEEMLCKALLALREAKEMKPTDARTRAYLAEAYERCGNHQAAEAERLGVQSALIPGQSMATEREIRLPGGLTVR
jgi:hypothetical protein